MIILFLEDDKQLQRVGIDQMELAGHTVLAAETVAKAQELLEKKSEELSIIVADHMLPDGEGIQFVLDSRSSFPDMQAVVVSGFLNVREREILESEKIPYFNKPVSYLQVLDEMEKEVE